MDKYQTQCKVCSQKGVFTFEELSNGCQHCGGELYKVVGVKIISDSSNRYKPKKRSSCPRHSQDVEKPESFIVTCSLVVFRILGFFVILVAYCLVGLVILFIAGSLLSSMFSGGYDPDSDSFNESLGPGLR